MNRKGEFLGCEDQGGGKLRCWNVESRREVVCWVRGDNEVLCEDGYSSRYRELLV